jgi:hypothetical protein
MGSAAPLDAVAHTVKTGETFWGIARTFRVKRSVLEALNPHLGGHYDRLPDQTVVYLPRTKRIEQLHSRLEIKAPELQKAKQPAKRAPGRLHPIADPLGLLASHATRGGGPKISVPESLHLKGVGASEWSAKDRRSQIMQHRLNMELAGHEFGVPPALLAALASRETNGGAALVPLTDRMREVLRRLPAKEPPDPRRHYGGEPWWGDPGAQTFTDADGVAKRESVFIGFGVCQINVLAHRIAVEPSTGKPDPSGLAHFRQTAQLLASHRDRIAEEHPTWTPAQQLQGAVVAWNRGLGHSKSWRLATLDHGTTKEDYSSDIWARARYLAQHWDAPLTVSAKKHPAPATAIAWIKR